MNVAVVQPKEEKKTVDQWLKELDYGKLEQYIPTSFAVGFIDFIKMVNGAEGEEHLSPVIHMKVMDAFTSTKDRIANMMHRGVGKTTLIEYLFLYLGVYGELPNFGTVGLAIYVSDSIDNGVKNMRKNLEYRWENSEFLQTIIPEAKFTDTRWEFINADGDRFIVKGYGAKTGVRGTKEMGQRPRLAVLDDLVSDEDARSPTVLNTIRDTVYKAIDYALHPSKSKIVWCGTPFNASDPLYEAVESGTWEVNVFPVCEQFPCTEEEFRGSWPDRFDWEYVNKKYHQSLADGKIASFNQELMLRIMSDEDRLVLDDDLRWYNRRSLIANLASFNIYFTTDFATSEKQSADNSFISCWAYNHNGDAFWIDGMCKRQTMDKNIEQLFSFVQVYNPLEVGIEVSGQQGGFIPWIQQKMDERQMWFNLASQNNSGKPGLRPVIDKLQRFNGVVPWFKAGKMYFPMEMKEEKYPPLMELLEEIRLATASGLKAKYDDGLDTISQLPLLRLYKPSNEGMPTVTGGDMWGLGEVEQESSYLNSYIV